jgi:energy-coupling factor transporter ATP-binding protein EcfA2
VGKKTEHYTYLKNKVIIQSQGRLCETPDELLNSKPFRTLLEGVLRDLSSRGSRLVDIFGGRDINEENISLFIQVLQYLTILDGSVIPNILPEAEVFFRDPDLLEDFVEHLYNAWRNYDRFVIVCGMEGDLLDDRPYRTFNETVEKLMHLVIGTYRDIGENITGNHPRIYRQARAGVDIATIVSQEQEFSNWAREMGKPYRQLEEISMIRQVLLYPPLVLNPPMNKRSGKFKRVEENPLDLVSLEHREWICYPAKVGELLIHAYIHEEFLELGLSLCNLFELAEDQELAQQPDAMYLFGVPGPELDHYGDLPTVFYDDTERGVLVGAIPNREKFGYFGYLKKMILTLHNITMMKKGRLPFHGALVKITLQNQDHTLLLLGESGAGKSETLEAFRVISEEMLQDMIIIADDMGSLKIANGTTFGYGTEIGAFIRLDDLQPGYEFGQMGRAIFMSPSQTNARLLLPVTSYAHVVAGSPIDLVFYANNYQEVDEEHPILEPFSSPAEALDVFREGKVMSKGTTTSQGIVGSYFGNVFGPPQYRDLHEEIAAQYFEHFFAHGTYVGQLRTRLGLPGWETRGPEEAARAMIELVTEQD